MVSMEKEEENRKATFDFSCYLWGIGRNSLAF